MSQTRSPKETDNLRQLGRQLKDESPKVTGNDHGDGETEEVDGEHTGPGQPHDPPEGQG